MEKIGEFEVTSGTLRVSDPCYETSTWCSGQVEGARTGKWTAFVKRGELEDWGLRVAELAVFSGRLSPKSRLNWNPVKFEVGVDSGQAGIFDLAHYRNKMSVTPADFPSRTEENAWVFDRLKDDPFYAACCAHTSCIAGAGVLRFGAVSSSGIGDGGYDAFVARNDKGEVVAVKIEFLQEDEEEASDA